MAEPKYSVDKVVVAPGNGKTGQMGRTGRFCPMLNFQCDIHPIYTVQT